MIKSMCSHGIYHGEEILLFNRGLWNFGNNQSLDFIIMIKENKSKFNCTSRQAIHKLILIPKKECF